MSIERTQEELSMARHPDMVALRERYEAASETSMAWLAEGLMFLAGTYTAISAWIYGFNATAPSLAATNLIVGIAVTMLAFGFATNYARTHALSWVTPLLGVWLIISPWIVEGVSTTTAMILSNVIAGAVVLVLGLAVAYVAMMRRRG
jgi:hypothetical protein